MKGIDLALSLFDLDAVVAPTDSDGVGRVDYDAELQRPNEVLRRSYGFRRGDHVLDIGCGAGQTTCDAGSRARRSDPGILRLTGLSALSI